MASPLYAPDESGKRYGLLHVIQRADREPDQKDTARMWVCRCDCGGITVTRGWMLRAGKSRSCGCVRKERLRAAATKPPGVAARNRAIQNTIDNGRRRGIDWNLTRDQALEIMGRNCHYCGVEPRHVSKARNGNFTYNGIDRVDSDGHYTLDNVVPCCGACNSAKLDMSLNEFAEWVRRVHARLSAWSN